MKKLFFLFLGLILSATALYADKPESHNQLWEYTHSMKAKQNIVSCTVCHTNEKTCLDCHKATFGSKAKPRSHKGDYVLIHRLDAKREGSTCSTCHEKGSDFCLKCHQSLNKAKSVLVTNPTKPQSHSATNWRTALHGAYAKRNLAACQACHPDLYTVSPCTTCHAGAANISKSPHPANFSASQFKDLTVCYKCHGQGVEGPAAGPLTL